MLHRTKFTLPPEKRDFPEWRRGRERYAVWILRCDQDRAVCEMFSAARRHLAAYLLSPYFRQPHITLCVCGFPAEEHRYNDDFTREARDRQMRALEKAAVSPFGIEIGGLNSFASAPFLEVHDPDGGIRRLREALSKGADEFRTGPYVPHLTVGLYAGAFPGGEVLSKMAAFPGQPVRCRVDRVTLAGYRAEKLGGELCYEHEYSLFS